MKLYLATDAPFIAQVLTDLLATEGHNIAQSEAAADATLRHEKNALTLSSPQGKTSTIPLPVHPAELLKLLAKNPARQDTLMLAHGWQLDKAARQLIRDQQSAGLTEKECVLLTALAEAAPEAVSHEDLLRSVFSYDPDIETHTLQTHIYRLRGKLAALKPKPCDILTLEGAYQLAEHA